MSFQFKEIFPGIFHIKDVMGVCMTLVVGTQKAVLIDTGYGIEDVQSFVHGLTDKPITVLLTHGHHDHILGAYFFPDTFMFAEDQEEFILRTGREQREKVMGQAAGKGLICTDDFLTRAIPMPAELQEQDMDLGGLTLQIRHVPGHTPGSFVAFIPEVELLLTGDDWNPCTWIWFPSALGIREWKKNMMSLFDHPFKYVLCSHQSELYTKEELIAFLDRVTEENINNAEPVGIGGEIDTRQILIHEGQVLVFDYAKANKGAV